MGAQIWNEKGEINMYICVTIYAEIEKEAITVNELLEEIKQGNIFSIDETELSKEELLDEGIEVE